jgi:ligand-binding sensor domain-containing protein
LVLLLIPATAGAERLPSRVFTTADGLPHNVVTRIVSDSHGYQWFCTGEGLSRFDSGRFITYGTEQGLPSGEVHDLLETRDGIYWVATRRGLVRFDPMGVPRPGSQPPMFAVVETIEPAEQRRLAASGRMRATADPIAVGADYAALSLAEDRSHNVWVGTRNGAARVLTAGFALFSAAEGIPAAASLIETAGGEIVAMTAGMTVEGAAWFDGRRFVPIQLPIGASGTSWGWTRDSSSAFWRRCGNAGGSCRRHWYLPELPGTASIGIELSGCCSSRPCGRALPAICTMTSARISRASPCSRR